MLIFQTHNVFLIFIYRTVLISIAAIWASFLFDIMNENVCIFVFMKTKSAVYDIRMFINNQSSFISVYIYIYLNVFLSLH